jgi:4-hydroxy-3-polyprenylbenzoate decarboxylase
MRARNGTLTLQAIVGKFVAAVDEDIDPENADSIFCAMSCRCNPVKDTHG